MQFVGKTKEPFYHNKANEIPKSDTLSSDIVFQAIFPIPKESIISHI
jgi:hypothetical protein